MAVVAVVAVVAVAALALRDDGGTSTNTGVPLPRAPGRTDHDPFARRADVPVVATPGSPAEAATAFLDAEVVSDLETSFRYLSADDRAEQGTPAGWQETHADLWTARSYRLTGVVDEGSDGATATADVQLEPMVDEFVGVVPARARLTLPLVREEGSWHVVFADSTYEPEYPDEAGAAQAVRTWAEARTRCATADEWDGGLLDSPYLAEQLCGTHDDVRLGRPDTLDALADAGPYLADFGERAADWARVVPVEGPVELDAVAAPLGDRWVVIGTSPPRGARR